jgi:hypothetical protein
MTPSLAICWTPLHSQGLTSAFARQIFCQRCRIDRRDVMGFEEFARSTRQIEFADELAGRPRQIT